MTLPQGAELPTVPRPLAHLVQPGTEPNTNHRFGFRPPPLATTARFFRQRPVVPPPVAVFSNSQATRTTSSVTTAVPPLLGQHSLNASKGHVTSPTIHTNDTPDSESSGDDGETDEDEESQLGCETDSSTSSSSGYEMIQLGSHTNNGSSVSVQDQNSHDFHNSHDVIQNPVHNDFTSHDFDGDRLQDVGAEDRYDNYDGNDPLLGMFLC